MYLAGYKFQKNLEILSEEKYYTVSEWNLDFLQDLHMNMFEFHR